MWRKISVLVLLFTLILGGTAMSAAQRTRPTGTGTQPEMRRSVAITGVTTDRTADGDLRLTVSLTQNDGCRLPFIITQEQSATAPVIFIEIERNFAEAADMLCTQVITDLETEVVVDAALVTDLLTATPAPAMLYLVLNDQTYIGLPITDGTLNPEAMLMLTRDDADIRSVTLTARDEQQVLQIEGIYQTTCLGPDITRQRLNGNTITVQVYKLVDQSRPCPQTFAPPTFKGDVPVIAPADHVFSGEYVVYVNNTTFLYDFTTRTQSAMSGTPIDSVIESAEVLIQESFPPQLVLVVRGYHPDSCEYPVIVQRTEDNAGMVRVRIFRLVPDNVRCASAVVPYEAQIHLGAFDPGSYTIEVNGVIVPVTL